MKFTSDIVIGLEIHIELDTNTKIFCSCPTKGSTEPNSRTCEVCLGHPGSKPVLNKKVVDYGIKVALALNSEIAPELVFSRKSYFYPDLAKNYQISQFELPLGTGGLMELDSGKKIGITRVHLEEDPASLVHKGGVTGSSYVLIDYNRSGNPLCEIVTEPDMTSPEEAREFMNKLITVLSYLGVFDQENGIIKADANISIKESGYVRSEIKNITGFKEIERALFYEVERQKQAAKSKEKFIMDTRSWDPDSGTTTRLRTKETDVDYGYILDPDLVVTELTPEWVGAIKDEMPELAQDKVKKFIATHKIPEEDAKIIANERVLAELFEKVAEEIDPVLAAKWLRRELARVVNYNELDWKELLIDETHLIELLSLVEKKEITENVAHKLMEKLVVEPFSPREYVEKEGLKVISDSGKVEEICKKIVDANPKAVEEFKAGKEKALNFLIGQVMRETRGAASQQEVNDIIKKLIGS
ncbi:Asp-tRNA(Asn)/Glu-tRNA(Gln) amidotransferase subunit GatB [Nanoarchaeota archaeon]